MGAGRAVIGRVKAWLAAAGAVILAVAMAFLRGRAAGKQDAQTEAMKDEHARVAEGRDAVRDGRGRGTPDERLRENDGRW